MGLMEESGPDLAPGNSPEDHEMNVTCPNCATVYRVDPAKVAEAGVRARCAVCSAVFAVRRESESPRPAAAPPRVEPQSPEPPRAAPSRPEPPRSEPSKPVPPRPEPPKPEPLKVEPPRP